MPALTSKPFSGNPRSTVLLDRDYLSDLVQTQGLSQAVRDVARWRDEAIRTLEELYRQVVIDEQWPDPRKSRILIDVLRSVGATSAVFKAGQLLTDRRLSDMRSSLFEILSTALISCEQAVGYLQALENGLVELAGFEVGKLVDWDVASDNEFDGPGPNVVH